MELNEKDIAQIERYFHQQMLGEELRIFESKMAHDAAFADEVNIYRFIMAGMEANGRNLLRAKLIDIGIRLDQSEGYDAYKANTSLRKKKYGKLWLLLVIVLIVGALAIYFYMNRENGEFNRFEPEPRGNEIPVPEPVDTSCAEIFTDSLGEMDTIWDKNSEKEPTVSGTKEELIIITADSLIMEDN